MSRVTSHVSHVIYIYFFFSCFLFSLVQVVKLIGDRSDINGAYPVYLIKKDKKPDTLAVITTFVADEKGNCITKSVKRF